MSAVLRCEISGEIATNTKNPDDKMVVTPSGHVAKRSLLLMKLSENGGMDPFVTNTDDGGRPLSESELIELNITSAESSIIPPRLHQYNTITDTLQVLQQEYDAILLELFDTRKALQETRQELSQALYQNDASIRVIARLVMERDNAQSLLTQYAGTGTSSNGGSNLIRDDATVGPATKKSRIEVQDEEGEPNKETDSNSIPVADLNIMLETWQELHSTRKARQKIASRQAMSSDQLKNSYTDTIITKEDTYVWNNSNSVDPNDGNRPVLRVICSHDASRNLVALTCNRIALLSTKDNAVLDDTIFELPGSEVSCIQSLISHGKENNDESWYAFGLSNGTIALHHNHSMKTIINLPNLNNDKDSIVDIRLHPDGIHLVTATSSGRVCVGRINQDTNTSSVFEWIKVFQPSMDNSTSTNASYSAGVLHPDGLIYIAGTTEGLLDIFDFKSQTCADSLKNETTVGSSVKAINVSSNGYHVAVAYSNDSILIWDLRKLNVIATLNNSTNVLSNVTCVEFDNSGKYVAFAGIKATENGGGDAIFIYVTTVKDWGETALLQVPTTPAVSAKQSIQITGLTWGVDNKITLVWDSSINNNKDSDDTMESKYQRNVVVFGEK